MRSPYLHPFLAAAFPVLFLYAHNAHIVGLSHVWSTLGIALAATAILLLVLRRLVRDAHKRSLVLTLAVVLFASYGHGVRWAPEGTHQRLGLTPEALVGIASGLFGIALVTLILRSRVAWGSMTVVVNVVTAALVALQLGTVAYVSASAGETRRHARASETQVAPTTQPPDIYFIVLDGYARADVLRALYAYDNTVFLDSLRTLGFQVLERSRANYCQTILSLAATLNLDYVPRLIEVDSLSRDRRPAHDLIQDNRLFAELRRRGYSIVAFASGFGPTELHTVDRYLRPGRGLSEFQQIVVSTTPLPLLMRLGKSQYDLHRERLDFILRELPQSARGSQPQFVFAHLIAPHPPFVFGPRGQPISRQRSFDFGDGSHYYDLGGSRQEYLGKYRNQLIYVSQRILATIGEILRSADTPPVIVLQSDHGPGSRLHWWSLPMTDLEERFGVLNAVYLPGMSEPLPADLSLVNTFRVILSHSLGADLEMLPDRSYYTVLTQPYYYFDVTRRDSLPVWPGGLDLEPVRRQSTQ